VTTIHFASSTAHAKCKNYRVLYDVTLKQFKNTTTKDNAGAKTEVGANVFSAVKLMYTAKAFHSPTIVLQVFKLRPVVSPAIVGNPNLSLTVQTSRRFPYMLPVAVARSSSDDSTIFYVLPVL